MNNLEKQFNRWIGIIRAKASEYEHKERRNGETVCQPDLDSICNEMEAFKNGYLAECGEKKNLIFKKLL